jgi:hypothetical protein
MASVRLTNELRSLIHSKAMEAFNLAKPEPMPSIDLNDKIRAAIIQSRPYRALKNIHDLCTTHGSFESLGGRPDKLKLQDVTRIYLKHIGERQDSLVLEFMPPLRVYAENFWGTLEFSFLELNPDDIIELRQPLSEVCNSIAQNHQDRHDYSNKILNLLRQCTTVKQMLTVWPAGESFVPSQSMSRMYEKVTRIERAKQIKEEVEFDDTLVNEVVLTAKLVGG